MFLCLWAQQPPLDILVFWLDGVWVGLRGSRFNCCYMRSHLPIRTLGAMVSSFTTTKALSFSHISSMIVGQECCSDVHYLSLYLHGCLLLWFSGIAVWVGFVFTSFCSHAFLVQRDGKQFEISKSLGLSSDQELLYLPLESLIEGRH